MPVYQVHYSKCFDTWGTSFHIFASSKAQVFQAKCLYLDFIWDFGKLPFPSNLGKIFTKIGKISTKIHEIGKIKVIFGLRMTPI